MPFKKAEELEEVETIDGDNGSKYKMVGKCLQCNNKVYLCLTHPLRDAGIDAQWAAVYVPGASMMGQGEKEAPQLYCQAHDPTRSMRREGLRPGDPIPGDVWQSQR